MADTGLDLVTDALKDLGVVASGETAEAGAAADGLRALNDLLDAWSAEALTVYRIAQINHTLVASQGSYTIGTAGGEDVSQARPLAVLDGSFIRDGNSYDQPLIVLRSRAEYDGIGDKTSESSYPAWVFYDPAYPSGTLYYWQVPDTAYTAYLNVPAPLTALALGDTVQFPPGYRRALRMNAALAMQDMFGGGLSNLYVRGAGKAKAVIKRVNLAGRQAPVRFPRKLRGRSGPRSAAEVQAGGFY